MKYCPDLTQKIWKKAMMVGHGDFQTIQLNECIGEKCVAYKEGYCNKYNANVKDGE